MSYQSLIDDAIARARVKVASGLPQPTDKLASAHGGGLIAEAEKIANALEYMALATADDGSAAGAARAEMVRDFFKTAAEADKKKGIAQPLVTETTTSGVQKVAPQAGKTKLAPQGLVSGDSPKQTTAPDGAMSRNAMEQTPSASPTKAASLYDMLMGVRMAKIAAESGAAAPRQMDASQPPPAYPKGQEGGHAQGPLSTNESIVAAKRRELHAPTRNRLSELFAHSGDTAQSMESAAGTFPLAAAKGGMKVASLAAAMQKEAKEESEQPGYLDRQQAVMRALRAGDKGINQFLANDELIGQRVKGQMFGGLKGLGAGGLAGLAIGGALGHPAEGAITGGALGSLAGQLHGGYKADKEHLAKKGIKLKYLGLDSELSPEAIEKYHHMRGEKKASVVEMAAILQKEATEAPAGAFNTPIKSQLARDNIDAATDFAQRGAGHVGDFLKTKGGRNVALGALGVGGVAAGTLYARKKLKDMKHGSRERRMMEIQKESSISTGELAALMQKEATDTSPSGAFDTPIKSQLARDNIDAATGYAQRGAGHVGEFLKTKGGRNVALGALGVGGVAAGTLYARKKLKDMQHGSRERRMRELAQGH